MTGGFRGERWRPPAPGFPVPRRSDKRTLPPLTFLPVPGHGPEHVVVDGRGRLLTGLADGTIVRVSPDGGAETIANTGGRPLGMELAGEDTLVIGDAERGLLRVRPVEPGASVEVLCDTVDGERLVFCSCPAIAADGTIYFSQSSRRYDLAHYKGDLLEHSGTGRVLRYRDGQVDVVADGLQFANGLLLSPGEASLIVAETGGYCVTRVHLDGAAGGVTEPVIENLPGFPDNLTAGPSGLIWIAMASPRDATLDLLLPRPSWLRGAVWALPDRLKPAPKDMAWVLAIDPAGRVVHDLRGWHVGYHEVTAVREHDGVLYLASIEEATLARAELPA
ncbi:MAG TPA: SMP-30/gluconolactonase/LRE family protein [Streptosporangiaceae bacterium]|nr:SMP-30/gluconolactonase/LRE family protein [Streptosporangiaceae bacterium]